MTIRTRFAPSPTGYLHIGGARTALFCWLFARQQQGEFLLRIEDTDRERSTQASIDAILESMDWLGLDYDGEAIYQTQRFARYAAVTEELLANGHAYRCTCSKERLETLRAEQQAAKLKPRYDGHCREAQLGPDCGPHVVRFRTPLSGAVSYEDLIHGWVTVQNEELDDLIIARTDGTPTYNFTVVVDDSDMQITHVIRGDDHVNNTPRQVHLFTALNAKLPKFAHVPMILGKDGKRLSKRHGAVSVLQYREEGFLPAALLNYLARLGWSHGDDEVFSRVQALQWFALGDINKSAASFDVDKLTWLNQQYLKTQAPAELVSALSPYLTQQGIVVSDVPALTEVIALLAPRAKTLCDLAQMCQPFYQAPEVYPAEELNKWVSAEIVSVLIQLNVDLAVLAEWQAEAISAVLKARVAAADLSFKQLAQPIRLAVVGSTTSPSIDATLALLGQAETQARLQRFITHCESQTHA